MNGQHPLTLASCTQPDTTRSGWALLFSAGTTAELLCSIEAGAEVLVSPVMGKGFPLDRLPASTTSSVLLFATGSGISPLRAVIDSGALAGRDVTLYYGTRNPGTCGYAYSARTPRDCAAMCSTLGGCVTRGAGTLRYCEHAASCAGGAVGMEELQGRSQAMAVFSGAPCALQP